MNSSSSPHGITSNLNYLKLFPSLDTFLSDEKARMSYRIRLKATLTDEQMDSCDDFADTIEDEQNVSKAIYLIGRQITLIIQRISDGFIRSNQEVFDTISGLTDDAKELLSTVKSSLEYLEKHYDDQGKQSYIFQEGFNAIQAITLYKEKVLYLNEWREKVLIDKDTTRVLCSNLLALVDLLDSFMQNRLSQNIKDNTYNAALEQYNLCLASLNDIIPYSVTIAIPQPVAGITVSDFILASFTQIYYAVLLEIIGEMNDLYDWIHNSISTISIFDHESIRGLIEDHDRLIRKYNLYRQTVAELPMNVGVSNSPGLDQLDEIYYELNEDIEYGIKAIISLVNVPTFN